MSLYDVKKHETDLHVSKQCYLKKCPVALVHVQRVVRHIFLFTECQ